MKSKIVAQNKQHLLELIKEEMQESGHECDLNHIDVSKITDMSLLFYKSGFNGKIDKWDVSNVTNMSYMFLESYFCGDISKWNVSKVKEMGGMFYGKYFYGNIDDWKPYELEIVKSTKKIKEAFNNKSIKQPYWMSYNNKEERKIAIDAYHLEKELREDIKDKEEKTANNKKMKI